MPAPIVPEFPDAYGRLPEMTVHQRTFYETVYAPSFDRGVPVELGENTAYAQVMHTDLMTLWGTDQSAAMQGMRLLLAAYDNERVASLAWRSLSDMHLLRGEWEQALSSARAERRRQLLVALSPVVHPRLSVRDVLWWRPARVTDTGWKIFDDITDDLEAELNVFHDSYGLSMLEDFWHAISSERPAAEIAPVVEPLMGGYFPIDRIIELIEGYKGEQLKPLRAFAGDQQHETVLVRLGDLPNLYAYTGLIGEFMAHLFRKSENRVREGVGLPRVGEGNVSEMKLLRELRMAFPDERIDHQVRPWWLAPQSLDIVFTEHEVAIEYQGAQHSRPVEFFGGAAAFALQQDRDDNKRMLCRMHGMRLIEVHPGYKLDDVVAQVCEVLVAAG